MKLETSSILQIIIIFLITISIAYIFGLTIVKLVDTKLSNIELKVPLNLQRDMIENYENVKKNNEKEEKEREEIIVSDKYKIEEGKLERLNKVDMEENNKKLDYEFFNTKEMSNKINGYDKYEDPQKEFLQWNKMENKKRVCIKDHKHDNKCNYGVTNYPDPKDISAIDLKLFVLNYPPNMTLQDYINWLWCFKDKPQQLPYNHLKNLDKLTRGIELKEESGILPPPSYYYPPKNAEQYFDTLYNLGNEFNLAGPLNSTTGPMLGYNYNDYVEFTQNNNVYGVSGEIRNPDIGLKKTAKEVDTYIIPHDSQNLQLEHEYKIYHVKDVEI